MNEENNKINEKDIQEVTRLANEFMKELMKGTDQKVPEFTKEEVSGTKVKQFDNLDDALKDMKKVIEDTIEKNKTEESKKEETDKLSKETTDVIDELVTFPFKMMQDSLFGNINKKSSDIVSNAKLRAIIDHYGVTRQRIQAIEEMSELQKELCKDLNGKSNPGRIKEEIADVYLMLAQLSHIYNISIDDIKYIMDTKIDRTLDRIKESNNYRYNNERF